ncbi:flagellar hook assembly protein FlgD [Piscinibacter koreensis]|uniref:Basal-body rod modification protein FlgD n=1 Tax=Piscinibacter koreensis TaxID=2742824 RepID=A0A7Y6NPI1_9BURK|nr:flagellar hook capping FlgD N-terminal domain-containing protein [Schlegelella koreensis]NUZ06824.1 flagellar hook assembly protein FlgD [Schlegelella koreensis]
MAVTATSNTQSAAQLAATAANADEAKATSDRFLKLLVAQMKNQDPLSPMDNAQVTSQMAQINTVSGIEKLNTTVASLSSQFMQLQTVQGAALVGRDVVVPGNRISIVDGKGFGAFELEGSADDVKVEVIAPGGGVIDTVKLDGRQPSGSGTFTWDASKGTPGTPYTFRVVASNAGVATKANPLMRSEVAAVSTAGNVFNLELANGSTVPYSAVKAFN